MKFWNLTKNPEEAQDGILDIDGEIVAGEGWLTARGAVFAKDFRAALDSVRNVTVRINSPGGDVMAGAEIYSAIREHSMNGKGTVTVIVTALAASAASVIAMAGDEILMNPTAYMMIHNPWTAAVGDAKEMRKAAKTLDVISEGLINAYQIRTGKSRDELKRMLEAETWMSAGTAVQEGFADGIIGMDSEAAARAPAVKMSLKSHGAAEIAARLDGQTDTTTTYTYVLKDAEKEETDPDKDPEEGGDPAFAPEKDPEEDPEKDPDEEEAKARKAIARRAQIAAGAALAAGW